MLTDTGKPPIQYLCSITGQIIIDLTIDPDDYTYDEAWVTECAMAIKRNQLQVIQQWLDKDQRLLMWKLEGDSTALHLACEFSSPELDDRSNEKENYHI